MHGNKELCFCLHGREAKINDFLQDRQKKQSHGCTTWSIVVHLWHHFTQLLKRQHILSYEQHLLSTEDVLTCHCRRSTGVNNNMNDGWILPRSFSFRVLVLCTLAHTLSPCHSLMACYRQASRLQTSEDAQAAGGWKAHCHHDSLFMDVFSFGNKTTYWKPVKLRFIGEFVFDTHPYFQTFFLFVLNTCHTL